MNFERRLGEFRLILESNHIYLDRMNSASTHDYAELFNLYNENNIYYFMRHNIYCNDIDTMDGVMIIDGVDLI